MKQDNLSNALKGIKSVYDYYTTEDEEEQIEYNKIDMDGNSEIDLAWEEYGKKLKKDSYAQCYAIRLGKKLKDDPEFKYKIICTLAVELYGNDNKLKDATKIEKVKKQFQYFRNRNFALNIYKVYKERFMKYNFEDYAEDYEEYLNEEYKKFKKEYDEKLEEKYLKELKKQYKNIKKDDAE